MELTPSVSGSMVVANGGTNLPSVPRWVQRARNNEIGRGIVQATAVQAKGYVAHTRVEVASAVARMGLQRVAELSHEAMRFTAQSPTAAGRFEAVADAFTSVVVSEIVKLGYDQ